MVAVIAAVLGYLFSRDNLVVGACFTGIACSLCVAVAYTLGGMMLNDENGAFNGKRLLWVLIGGIVAGIIGGLMMLT